MSDEDINSGARWAGEIAKELAGANFGVICVTQENMHNPWLLFEAGALSKVLSEAHVCPLLLGFEPSGIDGPLAQFQASTSNKDGIFKLLTSLNRAMSSPIDDAALGEIFEVWWPRLELKIAEIPASFTTPPKRSTEEILAELLELSREHLRRDNLRIEHIHERDKQFNQLHDVLDRMAHDARQALETRAEPLAAAQQFDKLLGGILSADQNIDVGPEQLAQLTQIAKTIANGLRGSTDPLTPFSALDDFKKITHTMDANDQRLYSELLTPKTDEQEKPRP